MIFLLKHGIHHHNANTVQERQDARGDKELRVGREVATHVEVFLGLGLAGRRVVADHRGRGHAAQAERVRDLELELLLLRSAGRDRRLPGKPADGRKGADGKDELQDAHDTPRLAERGQVGVHRGGPESVVNQLNKQRVTPVRRRRRSGRGR